MPSQYFEEPDARKSHVRICGGGPSMTLEFIVGAYPNFFAGLGDLLLLEWMVIEKPVLQFFR